MFKVGDIIRGKAGNDYTVTNEKAVMRVNEVGIKTNGGREGMEVVLLSHPNYNSVIEYEPTFVVENNEELFELKDKKENTFVLSVTIERERVTLGERAVENYICELDQLQELLERKTTTNDVVTIKRVARFK